ncbi:unnamed protein product [Chondrus crispus]|uniref:No apical meristem-associated C-terminal domain-containing protein n=1 Tax=Chondrus crispus TaxID=2769 RepID=R7QR73_CHOCR|nr:unnamed protein product [Chondrus crispus]CDF40639.1 unnamed protein product [Chondrus crispus]|eukprot:XP_005710933.1 unnamed protein product [Chondrus crispus]
MGTTTFKLSPLISQSLNDTPRTRGSNFTSEEDIFVGRAWIRVSEDPVTGSEQKGARFYDRMCDHYHTFNAPGFEKRTMESIRTGSKLINKECVKFGSCFVAVRRSKPTGVSEEDMIRMATEFFNDVQIQHPNDHVGRKFKFLPVWKLLRSHEKFSGGGHGSMPGGTQTASDGLIAGEKDPFICAESSPDGDEVTSTRKRPAGRKNSKEVELMQASRSKKLRLPSESVRDQGERNAALQQYNEILLFSSAPDGCDEGDAVAYFNLLRSEALKKARARLRDNNTAQDATDDQTFTNGRQHAPQRSFVSMFPEADVEKEISSSDR